LRQILNALRPAACAALLLSAASPCAGQSLDSLRGQYRIPEVRPSDATLLEPRTSPAMGASSPSGFGGTLGEVWMGGTWTQRPRFSSGNDGVAAMGFGLGDPYRFIGLDVDVISFSTIREGFLKRGGMDLEIHRYLGSGFAVGAGWENAVKWGFQDTEPSNYGVVSKWIQLDDDDDAPFSAVLLNVGVGNGRFRSQSDEDNGVKTVNVFGSVGVRVLGPASIIADWTGQDLYLGGSLAPLKRWHLVLSSGFADVTHNAGDGARLVASGGFSFQL
jgi:hypothetical protein